MNDQRFLLTQDGQYGTLVYAMQPGEQLSRFDEGMLMNNNISGILSYASEASYGGICLTFNILRGTRLSLLKNRALNGQNTISVLLGIVNVLLTAEQYMLREDRFVFDDDCIFVDTNSWSVNLVYIPTTGYSGMSFAQYVKFFITNGSFNYGNDAAFFMTLLNFVNANPNASPDELKSILERIQMNAVPSAQAQQPVQQFQQPVQQQPVQQQPRQPVQQQIPVQSAPAASAPVQQAQPSPNPVNIPNKPEQEKDNSEKGGFLSKMFGGHKSKESVPAGAVSGMNIPGMQQQAPGGALAGMNIPGMQQQAPGGAAAGMNIPGMQQQAPGGALAGMNVPGMQQPANVQNAAPAKQSADKKKLFGNKKESAPAPQPAASAAPVPEAQPAPEIMTVPAEQSPVTVLLNRGNYAGGGEKRAYLIGTNGERVAITASGFTVGKENTSGIANDYTIKNAGVSRNHAMFEIKDGKYYVIDMTSLNGTFVNGNRINSNIGIELKSGDVIVFADSEYKFVIE